MPPTSTARDGRAARAPVANNAANWFTAEQVSERWDIPRTTIWRWIRAGKLAAIRLPNGQYRIFAETVADFETLATVEVGA